MRQVVAIHAHRALREILLQGMVHGVVDDAEVEHQVGDGAISIAGERFGGEHGFVDGEAAPGGQSHLIDESLDAGFYRSLLDQRGYGDGTGVDHGIERAQRSGIEFDGIESVAAGFDAHVRQRMVPPVFLQCHLEGEGLADGLNGEFLVPIAAAKFMSIHGEHADSEMIWVGLCQFGDVRRHFAFVMVPVFLVNLFHDRLNFSSVGH